MTEHDDLIAEVERCLDGDLEPGERLVLFERLAAAPDAGRLVAEAVALQRRLGDLANAFEQVEPSAAFVRASFFGSAPASAGRSGLADFGHALADWLGRSAATLGGGALAGAALATWVLVDVLSPAYDLRQIQEMAANEVRMHVMDVPFRAAADTHDWTNEIDVAPGETVRLVVIQGHEGAYQLRFSCADAVDVSLVHSRPKAADLVRRVKGGGVQYTSLEAPKPGDVLLVTNNGPVSLDLSVAAANKGAVTLAPQGT